MWRTVKYGALRKSNLYRRAQEKYHPNSADLLFWKKVLDGVYSLGIRQEPFVRLFTAKFYFPCNSVQIIEFRNIDQLLTAMEGHGIEFEAGYDFHMMWKADVNNDHFYLDMSSEDDCKRRPKPSSVNELKKNPSWSFVTDAREQAMRDHLKPHEIEYHMKCHNTFDLHGKDCDENTTDPEEIEILRLQREKYKLMNDIYELGHYQCTDEAFIRLFTYQLLEELEADADGVVHDQHVRFSFSEMLLMGCHNSSKGGMAYGAQKGETKATTGVLATMEACSMFKEAAEHGHCTIRPHTMNCKEERNKPGKKEKMFIQLDHCMQIINYIFFGDGTDKARQYVQAGYLMGASLNGQVIDELLRLQMGLAVGTGRLTTDALRKLLTIQSDFESFELRQDKFCFLIIAYTQMMRYGSGVRDSEGHPNTMLRIVLASNFERKLLPDIRVGGCNTVWKSPGIQISGEPHTLVNNQKNHKAMVMMGQLESNIREDEWDPFQTATLEASPKNGDDGAYPDTPYVRKVLEEMTTHEPVKFTIEKKGSFISQLVDSELVNDGIAFCKMNFVLEKIGEREVITLQREYKNLHKVTRGNRSTLDPAVAMSSVTSQTQNVYGSDRYYNLLQQVYTQLKDKFGILENGELDSRDQTAIDSNYHFDHFPTQAEIRSILYQRDDFKIAELHRSLWRHYQFGVPAVGIARY